MYMELIYLTPKKQKPNNPITKWAGVLNIHFFKEDIQLRPVWLGG